MKRIPYRSKLFWTFLVFILTTASQAENLSGRVYEGEYLTEPPTAQGLSGVTVKLYGSYSSGVLGDEVSSYTTGSDGWYGLETEQNYEFFTIVCEGKSGYTFEGSSSVDGSASGEQIEYVVPLANKTLTGNKFWYTSETSPPENNPPVAKDDSATTPQDTAVDIDVLYNDTDPDGDPLHINSATDPPHGTTINHGGNITYTPDPGFTGTDTFDYTAGDGKGGTDTATVTVTVEQSSEPPAGTGTLDGYKRDADTQEGLENWRIFIDLNGNNEFDAGEPSDMTDSNGYYRIDEVEPGTYRVCEEMQDGWEPGGGSSACMEGIDIIAGTTTTQDFHNRRTEGPEPGTGTIRGMKYNDLNGNGQKDAGEPGLAGWTIFLDSNDNGSFDEGEPQTTTDANGNYTFTNLEAGVYRIHEVNKSGWRQTDPAVDGVPGYWLIDLEEGREEINIDFGNHREETPDGQEHTSDVCFNVEITAPDGTVEKLTLTGPMTQRVYAGPNGEASDTGGNGREEVTAELVSLNLSGVSSYGPITISLNINMPSIGMIEERVNNNSGILDIPPFTPTGDADSFFDVFFQLQIGGTVLLTPTNQPIRLTSIITHLPPLEGYSDISQTKVELLDQNGQPTGFYFGSITSCQEAPPEGNGGGSVVVVKEATPADDTPFLFCADFSPGGFFDTLCENLKDPSNNTWTFNNPTLLQKVSETVTAGWILKDITITGDTDNGSTIDKTNATVNVDFDEGENIVITFKNEKAGGAQYDFGDAPDSTNHAGLPMTAYPAGGPPGVIANFPTVYDPATGLPGGAMHQYPRAVAWLGTQVSLERDADLTPDEDGVTNINPQTDTSNQDTADDGVIFPMSAIHCAANQFTYTVTVAPGAAMMDHYVNVWFDWNRDGDWEDILSCSAQSNAPEWAIQNQLLPSLAPGTYTFQTPSYLAWNPPELETSELWMRISISEQPAQGPGGSYQYGETEDYYFVPTTEQQLDFGDAPNPYPEASHQLGGPYWGLYGDAPDAEAGMQRDPQAEGDDNDADGDDENGLLSIDLVKTPGAWSLWDIKGCFNSSSDAKIGFWIDLNGDGDWDDPNELRAEFGWCSFTSGPQDWFRVTGAFKMPTDAKVGMTYARLRVYNDCNAAISPSGAGGPGEVEDYAVEIKSDGPGLPPGGIVHGYKWNDINGNGLWDVANPIEPALAGWTFWLDINNNGQEDAGDMYEQTDATGHFRFTGVPAGTYTLGEQIQSGWTQTTPGGAGTYAVTVQPGQGTFPMMFGNQQSGGPTFNGRICGSKWNDLNGDGIPDATEPYMAGWTIYLDMNQNNQWDPGEPSQLTDASGSFEFTGLAVGSYIIAEVMQPGWKQTWPGVTETHAISIQSGIQPACVMFGNQQTGGGLLFDWGDAPDPNYPTLHTSNGAYHVIVPGIFLGGRVDTEPDGLPSPDALGDDNTSSNDEDGVTFITPIIPGRQAEVEVIASSAGYLDAWIDFSADGSWSQNSDQIFQNEAVIAGSNVLIFQVPTNIAIHNDTYTRFRFSSAGALAPDGPAQDGEVEDYHILLGEDGPYVPGEGQVPHVKWSQPPIEIDPNTNVSPVFCGWNEPARSTEQSGSKRLWRMDADDFHCLGPVPITRIRWWGGYKAWAKPEPPELQPETWHICFWANQVEGIDKNELFPERIVWSLEISVERVHFEPVGLNEFLQQFPEMCFVYEVELRPEEWFHQTEFESNDNIFWISITAVYPTDVQQMNMWGWMMRSQIWGHGAVMPAIMGDWPTYDERLFPGRIYPIENSQLCGLSQAYDLCFELLTEEPWVKWDRPFTGIREWQNYSDVKSMALEQNSSELLISQEVADDWFCERMDPVIAIVWNGSYIGYGYEACKCGDIPEPRKPDYFLLSIRTNAPVINAESDNYPGEKIWEFRAENYDEVLVGYDQNPNGEPNEPVFRYSVRLPEDAWFRQNTPENIYWLSVIAVYKESAGDIPYEWGWTNHSYTFGSPAMSIDSETAAISQWQSLLDSTEQPVDMSFMFLTAPEQ